MPDIRRMFQYHGAEHKTIACYEAGLELTVENIRGQSRFHPRCGTSFILIVLIISALIFSMVSWDSLVLRVGLKLLLLPVVMGISYELLKLAGRYTNVLTKIPPRRDYGCSGCPPGNRTTARFRWPLPPWNRQSPMTQSATGGDGNPYR